MTFSTKFRRAIRANRSLLCIGLDPDPDRLPVADVLTFTRAIVAATADLACAFKPNFAFFEQLGPAGWDVLAQTIAAVPAGVPVIGDAKRGDIGHTAAAYARACFDRLGCDAVTVNPYLGRDAIEPFTAYTDRGVFLLCRTSNPGGADFQDRRVIDESGTRPLYEIVAERAAAWNTAGNLGLVVGATYPAELARVQQIAPDLPLLVPGVGAQGGDLAAVVRLAGAGAAPIAINVSRQVLYAAADATFAEAARAVADDLRRAINDRLPANFYEQYQDGP